MYAVSKIRLTSLFLNATSSFYPMDLEFPNQRRLELTCVYVGGEGGGGNVMPWYQCKYLGK